MSKIRVLLVDDNPTQRRLLYHALKDEHLVHEAEGAETALALLAEQLFDLVNDRSELHDLASDPSNAARVAAWRQRLIAILEPRGDGFVEDGKLVVRKERWGPVVEA